MLRKIVSPKNKKLLLGLVVGLVIGSIFYVAAYSIAASNVIFDNTNSELGNGNSEISVEDAINALKTKVSSVTPVNAGSCKQGYDKGDDYGAYYECTHKNPSYSMPSGYICQRAKWLHKEKCNQTSNYCYADGYTTSGSMRYGTITYGQFGNQGTLATGDAFDCDVNGDGKINVDSEGYSTERFYYVSDYWNQGTDINNFDTNYAVLIYYRNFYNRSPSNSGAAYASLADIQAVDSSVTTYDNWHGPVTAIKHLPTTSTWSNITLKTTSRTIYACSNGSCGETPSLTTTGGTITNPFSYTTDGTTSGTALAGRLLTVPELRKAGCPTLSGQTSLALTGGLSACNFLFERTYYAKDIVTTTIYGPWLETPSASATNVVWYPFASDRRITSGSSSITNGGVRPAIEILKSKISY